MMQGGYYAQPGMNPGMMGGMNGMGGMSMPGMQQAYPPGAMMGGGGMGMGMGMGQMGMGGPMGGMMGGAPGYGNAWRSLDYNYNLPQLGYKPEASWGPWDLASKYYTGDRLERGFFDNIISGLTNFFAARHLSEEAARNAHRRVYHLGEGEDSGSKSLGGAAAYQAFLLWDRDHHSLYHTYPTQENRERLVALAVAELFKLWDQVQPRSSRAVADDAAQYAAATAKYLFERHYEHNHGHGSNYGYGQQRFGGGGRWGYNADDESDGESEGRRRRKSFYGQPQPYGMGGMMQPGMMPPGGGMGMSMGPMGGMGTMGTMGGMPMGMNPMILQQQQLQHQQQMGLPMGMNMNPMMMNPAMLGQGMHGQMGEAQAGPGMHPYTYGPNSGVAWGNQPIDQMGNPTFPGGPGRSWYNYGQPRYM